MQCGGTGDPETAHQATTAEASLEQGFPTQELYWPTDQTHRLQWVWDALPPGLLPLSAAGAWRLEEEAGRGGGALAALLPTWSG